MKRDFLWIVYKVLLLLAMLASFQAWFAWNMIFIYHILLVYSVFLYVFRRYYFKKEFVNYGVWLAFLFISILIGYSSSGFTSFVYKIISICPLFFVISLKTAYKEDFLFFISNVFSVFLIVSIVGWGLCVIGISSPYQILEFDNSNSIDAQYVFENHYLFLMNITRLETILFPRFCSVFLEPGYLGCLMVLLLCVRKFKLDRKNIVFYITLFFTFSLAGYILLFIGAFLRLLKNTERKLFAITIFASFIGLSYFFIRNYNNGNNYMNDMILSRMEYDEDKGIEGNNRSSYSTDKYFWNRFIKGSDLMLGVGKNADRIINPGDTDWKVYVIRYGLISTVCFLSFIFYPLFRARNKSDCLILSTIYFLIFVQTSSMITSLMYLTIYMLGSDKFETSNNI